MTRIGRLCSFRLVLFLAAMSTTYTGTVTAQTVAPTKAPTARPTARPTKAPTTAKPTKATTTAKPTKAPTTSPTLKPTGAPQAPTRQPTPQPTPQIAPFYARDAVAARVEVAGGIPDLNSTGCFAVTYGCNSGDMIWTTYSTNGTVVENRFSVAVNAPPLDVSAVENCACFPANTTLQGLLHRNDASTAELIRVWTVSGLHLLVRKATKMVVILALLDEVRVGGAGSDAYQIVDPAQQAAVRAAVDALYPGFGATLNFVQRSCVPNAVVPTVVTQAECTPTTAPTPQPTFRPTKNPVTQHPTKKLTATPTGKPVTPQPTGLPLSTPKPTRASPTSTPTESPLGSPKPTGSPLSTPKPTLSPTSTPTESPLRSPKPTGSPLSTPKSTLSPTSTPTGSPLGSPKPTGTPLSTPKPTLSPTPTSTGTPTPTGGSYTVDQILAPNVIPLSYPVKIVTCSDSSVTLRDIPAAALLRLTVGTIFYATAVGAGAVVDAETFPVVDASEAEASAVGCACSHFARVLEGPVAVAGNVFTLPSRRAAASEIFSPELVAELGGGLPDGASLNDLILEEALAGVCAIRELPSTFGRRRLVTPDQGLISRCLAKWDPSNNRCPRNPNCPPEQCYFCGNVENCLEPGPGASHICSIPAGLNLDTIFGFSLKEACCEHDMCFFNGMTTPDVVECSQKFHGHIYVSCTGELLLYEQAGYDIEVLRALSQYCAGVADLIAGPTLEYTIAGKAGWGDLGRQVEYEALCDCDADPEKRVSVVDGYDSCRLYTDWVALTKESCGTDDRSFSVVGKCVPDAPVFVSPGFPCPYTPGQLITVQPQVEHVRDKTTSLLIFLVGGARASVFCGQSTPLATGGPRINTAGCSLTRGFATGRYTFILEDSVVGSRQEFVYEITGDADGDGVLDACDICSGGDDSKDSDGDGVPDFCDPDP